jgi:Fe-S cluster biogenesis protein NfuA
MLKHGSFISLREPLMFIQTEQTPNPATLKFLPGRMVMPVGTANFTDAEAAARLSPLAERLFALPQVTGVFLGADFITVTKDAEGDWYQLKPGILAVIMEHFTAGRPNVLVEATGGAVMEARQEDEDEVVSQIKELLETRVRPAVAQDGGDIIFQDYEDGVVYLHMQGSCSGCPSSTATLKAGIENMLRHYIPEVVEVRAV